MFEYDVTLSFAGEDRDYVEKLADKLKERGIKVFYDKYETGNLWGKDLYQHLNDIYKNKAEYCIIFISKYYREKLWTKHELKSAQSRAFNENKEYILPIILDNTKIGEIEGLNDTIGYIEACKLTHIEIVNFIEDKLNRDINIFWECKDVKELFEESIRKIAEISRTDYNQIILYAATGSHSYGLIVVADAISFRKQKYRIVVMEGLINKCFRSGEVIKIGNVHKEQGYFQAVYETKSELIIPIRSVGNIVGVINVESEEQDYFNLDMIEEIRIISKHLGKMLEKLKFDNGYYKDIPYISL